MDKNRLISELTKELFKAETRRLECVITELNTRNRQLRHLTTDGFMYGGKFYMPTNVSTILALGQAKNSLDFSLNAEMESWLRDTKIINEDRDQIRQMLFLMLRTISTQRELRNVLPECLVSMIYGLNSYPRLDPDGYTLRGSLRGITQYQKLLPKMEIYSVSRLFY